MAGAETLVARVSERVAQGGHFVPEPVVRRRFLLAGRAKLEGIYKPLVDAWALYDNSGIGPVLLDWGEKR